MAAIRIDHKAFVDPRFKLLGETLKLSRFDARGRVEELWSYCTENQTYFMTEKMIDTVTECVGFARALANGEIGLAEESEQGFRIKGTKGRIEWLKKLRKNAKKGGIARASQKATQKATQTPANVDPESSPLTLTLSSSSSPVILEKKEEESIGRTAVALASPKTEIENSETSVAKRKKSKFSAEHSAKAQAFVAAYVKAYQTRFPASRPEDLNDGKVRGQIMAWIKDYPLERACALIQVYFQIEEKWFGTKGYDFLTFRNNLNKLGQALDSGQDPNGINWAHVFGRSA
jgi:hypothetical protein